MPALSSVPTTSTTPAPAAPALVLVPAPVAAPARNRGRLARRLQSVDPEAGMTTAEYAIGTVAACGFGGVLFKLITSDTVFGLLTKVISKALSLAF